MKVLRDDGLYRHLRFAAFETKHAWHWRFDVLTWPGYLALVGDIADGYVFARVEDMLTFFNHPRINPRYWGEKVVASRWPIRKFSEAKFHEAAATYFELDRSWRPPEELGEIKAEWDEHLSYHEIGTEDLAIAAAMSFEHRGFRLEEFYEHDCKEWDIHFLFACFAAQHAAREYLSRKEGDRG